MLRNKNQNWSKMKVANANSLLRLGSLFEQRWVWAWVLKFNVFQRPSWNLQKSIWTSCLGSKWGPKTVLQSVFFRVPTSRHDYWKKCTPHRRKPIFLHVDEVWKCVDLGFQNRSKIVTFSTSILEAIFVDFWSENEGFGGPSWRPNFSKNRSQDDSLEVLKNVSLKLSCGSLTP